MITVSLYHRYRNALIDIASASHDRQHITTDAANLALLLALDELDAAWQERKFNTVDHIDSAAQIIRLNDWCAKYAPDEYHQPGDTADAIIAVADRLRGQVAKLRTELAAAIDERNHLDGELRASQNMMNSAHDEAKANAKDAHELRQQLAQLDADNAALIQRNTALAADLATARSYFISRQPTNGHDITDDFGAVITNPPVLPIPSAQPAIHLTWPDDLADWVEGLYKGRHDWRKLPRKIRWQLIANVVRQIPPSESSPTNWFDAHRPIWMSTARAAVLTFGSGSWESIATLVRNDEVPA